MNQIKKLTLAVLLILSAHGAQGMFRAYKNPERHMRMKISRLVREGNVEGLNELYEQCAKRSAAIRNRFYRQIADHEHKFFNKLLLGLEPATLEALDFYEQIEQLNNQSDVSIKPSFTNRQAIEYLRNNANGLSERQKSGILRLWYSTLQNKLLENILLKNGPDMDAVKQLLVANFDGVHPGREQYREDMMSYLLEDQHFADTKDAVQRIFLDEVPAVQVNQQTNGFGNWVSNHKIVTVAALAAMSALGYYAYNKWKKSRDKGSKDQSKEKKQQTVEKTALKKPSKKHIPKRRHFVYH